MSSSSSTTEPVKSAFQLAREALLAKEKKAKNEAKALSDLVAKGNIIRQAQSVEERAELNRRKRLYESLSPEEKKARNAFIEAEIAKNREEKRKLNEKLNKERIEAIASGRIKGGSKKKQRKNRRTRKTNRS